MKWRLIACLIAVLLSAERTFAAEAVTLDSSTRSVINSGVVNFAPGQLQIGFVAVSPGGGGGGGGGASSIALSTPNLFNTPVNWTQDGSGNWTASLTLATQAAFTFFGNSTSSASTPGFMSATAAKAALGLANVENTALSTWAGSGNITQIGTLTAGTVPTSLLTGTLAAGQAPAFTGDVTSTGGSLTLSIGSGVVSYTKIQNVATNRLLGRSTAGAGSVEEITPGTGLSLASGILGVAGLTSSTAIQKGNGGGGFTAAIANADFDIDSRQTVGDANLNWTSGKTTLVQNAAQTANRTSNLPPASAYAPGKTIAYVDAVTTGNFGRAFSPNGSDTLAGAAAPFTPFIAGGVSGLVKVQWFQTDGVSVWTALGTGTHVTSFQDQADAAKQVTVNVSGQTPGAGLQFIPNTIATGYSLADLAQTAGLFVVGSIGGNLQVNVVHWFDVVNGQDTVTNADITSNSHTVPAGTNSIRITATLTAPLTLVLPAVSGYDPGDAVNIYDGTGSLSAATGVTLSSATTDTFNGNSSFSPASLQQQYGSVTIRPDSLSSNWSVPTLGGSTGSGLNIGSFVPLTDAATISQSCDQSLDEQNWTLTMTTGVGATRTLVIGNAREGERGDLIVTHNSSGSDTLIIQGAQTASGGIGLMNLSSAANTVDRIRWKMGPANKVYVGPIELNLTAAAAGAACTTLGDTNGAWTGTTSTNIATSSGTKYVGGIFTPTTGNTAVCTITAPIFKTGSPTGTLTGYLYTDSGTGPGTVVATSTNAITPSGVTPTDAAGALAAPLSFTFTTQSLSTSSNYYFAVGSSTFLSTSNCYKWVNSTAGGPDYHSATGTGSWVLTNINGRLFFKTYH